MSPDDAYIDTTLIDSAISITPKPKVTVFTQHLRRINALNQSRNKNGSPSDKSLDTLLN